MTEQLSISFRIIKRIPVLKTSEAIQKNMKITDIQIQVVTIPLITTFKTALRTVRQVENVLITVLTDSGLVGFGGAAPAAVITGDTVSSIVGGIEHIRDNIVGMDIDNSESILQRLNSCIIGSMSAKAAVDMAVYDLMAKSLNIPLYRLLGGRTHDVETDITISIDSPEKMAAESKEKVGQGFATLKIKVGGNPKLDIQRLQSIHEAIDSETRIIIDANQGWSAKEAVQVGKELERRAIAIELMEQPVPARDFEGLRYVRDNVAFPVYADESVFSPQDALKLIGMHAVDGLNIKAYEMRRHLQWSEDCRHCRNGGYPVHDRLNDGIPCQRIGCSPSCCQPDNYRPLRS